MKTFQISVPTLADCKQFINSFKDDTRVKLIGTQVLIKSSEHIALVDLETLQAESLFDRKVKYLVKPFKANDLLVVTDCPAPMPVAVIHLAKSGEYKSVTVI